ncbi:MAG: WecB/TagA/CpsF family glycosyltransferase [Candidatus Pacebacteria bacterium]|nr:WecB/TagA/CpsF family glycosyltransferase [Candidatus Paceibacterota bacterium]
MDIYTSHKADILDVPICGISLKEFLDIATDTILSSRKTLFTTVNTYSIVMAQKNRAFLNHFKTADFVLPDGIGIVWAIRSLGKECRERVAGPEFANLLLAEANKHQFSIYFLGSTEENLNRIIMNINKQYPLIKIAGCYAPPFVDIDDMDHNGIVKHINDSNADILFVGMTAPKQELFLSRNYQDLSVSFMMGVGAAFDYLAGVKRQCPPIVGKLGLEWLFRLITSPRHVWRREISIPIFIYHFLTKQYFAD